MINDARIKAYYPPAHKRLLAVWYRHYRVYTRNLLTNGFPPFFEPLFFLAAMGFGFSRFMGTQTLEGLPFMDFVASGLILSSALYTSAFECTYGTFIRLTFDKTYDSMLAAPLLPRDIIVGEIFWASTKGAFYSSAVLCMVSLFGLIGTPGSLLTPVIGFFTGMLFAVASLLVTSFVRYNLDHFNFYFTGFLTPLFFFCGLLFPVSNLPAPLDSIAEALPLTHLVRLERAICFGNWEDTHLIGAAYCLLFIFVIGWIALRRLERRLID
jgi:lipooligosaccharide transport system permease protein